MNKDYQIRQANLDDAEAITNVHIQAWQESYKDFIDQAYLDKISFRKRLQLRKKILQNSGNDTLHLVALHKNQIIGFCDVGPSRNPQNSVGEIYAIYLLDEFKQQKIGTALWNAAKEHLAINKLLPFTAIVLEKNLAARKFYQAQGGIESGHQQVKIGGNNYSEIAYIFD